MCQNALMSILFSPLHTDEPSMCYFYDGDGVCEEFEQETSVRDCGLYTPSGFLDQWAAAVDVSHEERLYCPADVAAGYPAVTKVSEARPLPLFCTVAKLMFFHICLCFLSPISNA